MNLKCLVSKKENYLLHDFWMEYMPISGWSICQNDILDKLSAIIISKNYTLYL